MTRTPFGPVLAVLALPAMLVVASARAVIAVNALPQAVAERAPDGDAFPVPLSSFASTLIGSTTARTANVRLAAKALDGTVVASGEDLSFNAVVGARTKERGYQDAPVILRETRQVQVGGGICQVATNLFVAGLLAGLTPVERFRHSSPVDYVALGQDATIAWGVKDLRLRNDGTQPMRLRVEVVGRTLTVRFEGAEPLADRFELEREDRELPAASSDGTGTPGREIELYRVRVAADGTVDREFILRDVYPPSRPVER